METLGAKRDRISAAVGPCIARASYEVDDGFFRRFAEVDPANERFFADGRPGHHQFDLEAYVAHRLAAAGIARPSRCSGSTLIRTRTVSIASVAQRTAANPIMAGKLR